MHSQLQNMIGVQATITIKEGANSDFEKVAKDLVEKVNSNEEGVIYYDLYKKDEITYVFFEKYKDKEALDVHRKTDYFKSLGAQLGAFMAGPPQVEVLQLV